MEDLKSKLLSFISSAKKVSVPLLNKIPTPIYEGASTRFNSPKDHSPHYIPPNHPSLGLGTVLLAAVQGNISLLKDDKKFYVHQDDLNEINKELAE